MDIATKRKNAGKDDISPKRVKMECSYGEGCYRKNPAHFREYSHPHLEAILDASSGDGDFPIPDHLSVQRHQIIEQLEIIIEKQLYEPKKKKKTPSDQTICLPPTSRSETSTQRAETSPQRAETSPQRAKTSPQRAKTSTQRAETSTQKAETSTQRAETSSQRDKTSSQGAETSSQRADASSQGPSKESERDVARTSDRTFESNAKPIVRGPDYVPIVRPTRSAQEYLKVVRPSGKMADKHAQSAPYHIFYTTITSSSETHSQPYSVTFLELLDLSLGELKCSLQINFMVEIAWLMAQYYFAGYSQKKLTILYGEDASEDSMLTKINKVKPHVDAHKVRMTNGAFGTHHSKLMVLCYEDGSLRVVVSTANLYSDDWENRTQGLWLSPACPELPPDKMPHEGDSPTQFKKYLLRYLHYYNMPQLSFYIERVKRCDFSHINVFLVASVPGGHFDSEWGLTRCSSLLRQHCCVPCQDNRLWPLVAQASSIGSFGKEPRAWLTGDFLHHFTKIKNQSQMLSQPAELKFIYPSLENVRSSYDGLLGGGCLPYGNSTHSKQPWLNNFLYQWKASHTHRSRAMPHIKTYTRIDRDANAAAYYLLTSANLSKAAWGNVNKSNAALRIMNYEAGVLFLPMFVINEPFFPLKPGSENRLIIPYDLPPTKYAEGMSPWVQDYLHS